MTRFARGLARALWKRAAEAGKEDQVESALERAYRVFRANSRFRQVMMHPKMDSARRAGLLSAVCEPDEITGDLLLTLAEHRAFSCFGEVLRAFKNQRAARSDELAVEVCSADPLSQRHAEQLTETIERATGRKIKLRARTRRDLLGGLRLRVGELTIDGTLRGAFERLEKRLVSS